MEQGSPEWHAARVGLPTASNFSAILASGRDGGPSKMRRTYMRKLAGERITGEPAENYTSADMRRGKAMEAEARAFYEFTASVEVKRVGLIKNHGAGASPDGLVGSDGLLEIKTAAPHVLIEHIEAARVPSEHVAQVQGQMWISERQWNDLLIFWPGMRPFKARVGRADRYIEGKLQPAVLRFIDELEEMVERLSSGGPAAIAPAAPAVDLSTAPPAF